MKCDPKTAAGQRDDQRMKKHSIGLRQTLERFPRIRHKDAVFTGDIVPFGQHRHGAGFGRLRDIGMPVKALALQRDKQIPRVNGSRVG